MINAVLFFRIIEYAFFGKLSEGEESYSHGDHHHHEDGGRIEENPLSMLIPLVLAAMALVAIGLFNKELAVYLEQFLNTVAMGGQG